MNPLIHSRALRAVERDFIHTSHPWALETARQSGNWAGAIQQVYAHQLESGWLPPRLTVTDGAIAAEIEELSRKLEVLRKRCEQQS